MSVTRDQAEQAMRQLTDQLNRMGPALAADLGVGSVTFEFGGSITADTHPYWTATTRKGTTVHQAGTGGYTADPCHRSMRTGTRLTRAEADALFGRVWCPRCIDTQPTDA